MKIFLLIILLFFYACKKNSKDFNKESWFGQNSYDTRFRLADELIKNHLKIGNDTVRIYKLIGKPNSVNKNILLYEIGNEFYDYCYLIIELDSLKNIKKSYKKYELYVDAVQRRRDEYLETIVCPIEKQPSFQFGNDSLYKFIYSQIDIPKEYEQSIWESNGKVFVSFYIEKDGSISNPKIIKSMPNFPKLDNIVLKAIKKMPKWEAGIQSGKPVRVKYYLPVKFGIDLLK